MLLEYLHRVPEFARLAPAELSALAQQSAVVCVPAGRTLVGPDQRLHDYLYLLKGSLAVTAPARRLRSSRFGQVSHFSPGVTSARTHTACHILRIDRRLYEFACQRDTAAGAMGDADAAPWLRRFLSSHMMKQLSGRAWQQLVRSFAAENYAAGQQIIAAGSAGTCCYVIEAGHAVVQRDGVTLCHLNPGDFFGEDALLLDAPRNASVTALSPLKVQKIHGDVFREVLVDNLIEFVAQRGRGHCLNVEDLRGRDVRAVAAELPARQRVYVVGGRLAERGLVTFLLVQQGCRAQAVAD